MRQNRTEMSDSSNRSRQLIIRMRGIVFVAIGVTLITLSIWFGSNNWSTLEAIALNLGLVTVAVVLVGMIWRLSGGNPIEEEISALRLQVTRLSETIDSIESREQIGLEDAYRSPSTFNADKWVSLIKDAEKEVDLMGRTLYGWKRAEKFKEIVKKKVGTPYGPALRQG